MGVKAVIRWGAYSSLLLSLLGGLVFGLDRLFPFDVYPAQTPSIQVVDAQGKLLRGFTTAEGTWRLPLSPETVDPLYLRMLKAYEDKRFDWHPGVDPLALMRALWQWVAHGKVISGASTLTMQSVRLLDPRPRTLPNKLAQMWRALQLDWHYTKEEILGLYLTLAPYGGNLEGLRAASLAYLGKEPRYLTPAEAALLVVLPQSPTRLRPDRFPRAARAARDKVLARMERLGVLSRRQAAEARQEDPPGRRLPLPFHAPHLARRLVAAEPRRALHRTYIEGRLQRMLEALAKQVQTGLDPHAGLAILIVENQTRRVIAYVGSSDFFAQERAGQVDMVRAVRSPGSTLKPLIYGLGFDELIIHPETLIDDAPTRFGDYFPSNFRHTYRGQVSVREALQRSLNIPAVKVLERIGPVRLAAKLRDAGIELHWARQDATPGLPLALGGVGTTLEDLVMLYVGFANAGQVGPLALARDDRVARQAARPLLSAAAAWYLADILAGAAAPETKVSADHVRDPRRRAYKTGTSYGFRDAWALGFDGAYTVGVWVGRPDGAPSPGRYGRKTAAPLLYRVFDLLPRRGLAPPGRAPAEVLQARYTDLPERLKHFRSGAVRATHSALPPLAISFPVDGARIALDVRNGVMADLPLIASGGQRPLRWLVNGYPLPAFERRRDAFWTPDGEGFVAIAVMDGRGQSARANVWVDAGEPGAIDSGSLIFRLPRD
jgi:penicillin-binding protein 1C